MSVYKAGIGSEFGFSPRSGYPVRLRGQVAWSSAPVTYTANGRAALGLAARAALQRSGRGRDRVLLPAYLCHSMIQPFEEAGLHVDFYPVGRDLSAEAAQIAAAVTEATAAVMLMHYFGFPQPADLAGLLLSRFPRLTIIDDRTHVLLNRLPAPGPGVIAISSPRKWGPFPDLGLVEWPAGEPRQDHLLDRGYDYAFGFWRLVGGFLRALFFAWPVEPLRRRSLAPLRRADALLDRRVRVCKASPFSRLMWRCWDQAVTIRRRRENYQYLLNHWSLKAAEPLFNTLPEGICPLGFPIRTPARDDLRRHLIANGIYPPVHWLRPDQIDSAQFPEAALLAQEELTLVIDQRYGIEHLDHVLEVLAECG